jgi:ferritin-like metal-binding protein YciE
MTARAVNYSVRGMFVAACAAEGFIMRPVNAADQLITWLDDAYAMESGLISILEKHSGHFNDLMPDVARRLEQHIVETQQHVQRLSECLRMLNAQPSVVKSTLSAVVGLIEGAGTVMFTDQLVKDALADYGAEQFEVACYMVLVTAAQEWGFPDVARLCRQNLDEDHDMATWLLDQLPAVTLVGMRAEAQPRVRAS